MNDSTGVLQSNFYELQDVITPSIYNFYNVDNVEIGKRYLAYNLFTIEVNQAWSPKEQLVYCWLNYHPSSSQSEALQPWMAEATAIFPFMAGATGLYPWYPSSYDTYEHFVYGLYRLSAYNSMFHGNQTFVTPEPAHNSFVNETPIWRGVVNNNEILIAAQNPFANPNDTTLIQVAYDNWSETIGLVGNETFLCKFSMTNTGVSESENLHPESKVYPNPGQLSKGVKIVPSTNSNPKSIELLDLQGKP